MPKRLTVFYSWQSDSPANLNRSFIEKALREALGRLHSDAALENALRDATVELDKDTQGVAGSPPIAQTILNKIEECAVFVADLSFVGESKMGFKNASGQPRQFSNPNVLIEYGYALKCHSHAKLIGIMNTAHGKPNAESLPFDLRHLRWPISYHLADSSSADKQQQYEGLVDTLAKAIGLILSNHSAVIVPAEKFTPQKETKNASVYFENDAELVSKDWRGGPATYRVPSGAKAYLRVYPSSAVAPIDTELQAKNLCVGGGLRPFGEVNGFNNARNEYGSIVYDGSHENELCNWTQLFLSREIWGIDAKCINSGGPVSAQRKQQGPASYIPNVSLENIYVTGLVNYVQFARKHLDINTDLKIEAGLVGIKGYAISLNNYNISGDAIRDAVKWQGKIVDDIPVWDFLGPFFDRIWDNCGSQRTAQHHDAYATRFRAMFAMP